VSGRSGIGRIWFHTGHLMLRQAIESGSFWWIIIGAPIAAMLLDGFSHPLLSFPSALVWGIPAALITGWPSSDSRKGLRAQLALTSAGSRAVRVPEIILPAILSSAAAMLLCYICGLYGAFFIPWQTYVIIPFSALSASALLLLLDTRMHAPGRVLSSLLYASPFLLQQSSGRAAEVVLPPGYTLFTLLWGNGMHTGYHADTYMALAVFSCLILVFLAGKFSA